MIIVTYMSYLMIHLNRIGTIQCWIRLTEICVHLIDFDLLQWILFQRVDDVLVLVDVLTMSHLLVICMSSCLDMSANTNII